MKLKDNDNINLIYTALRMQRDLEIELRNELFNLAEEHNRLLRFKWFENTQIEFLINTKIEELNFFEVGYFNQDFLNNYEKTKRMEYVFNNILEIAFQFQKNKMESGIYDLKIILQNMTNLVIEHNKEIKRLKEG